MESILTGPSAKGVKENAASLAIVDAEHSHLQAHSFEFNSSLELCQTNVIFAAPTNRVSLSNKENLASAELSPPEQSTLIMDRPSVMKTLQSLFCMKHQLMWILFFSYIYDPIRVGYIESKRKNLLLIRDKFHLAKQQRSQTLPSHIKCFSKACCLPVAKDTQNRLKRRPTRAIKDDLSRLKKQTATLISNQYRRLYHRHSNEKRSMVEREEAISLEDDRQQLDDCPLGEMPLLFKYYKYLSHSFMTYMIIKYALLKLMHIEAFGLKMRHDCLIPGRITILPEYSPDLALMISSFHVIYRMYLWLKKRSSNLHCFLYLLYSKETILFKERRLLALQRDMETELEEAYREFLENRFFYHQVNTNEHNFMIKFKMNRTIGQRAKLKRFVGTIVSVFALNFVILLIPLFLLAVYGSLSDNHWRGSYGHCAEHYSFIDLVSASAGGHHQSRAIEGSVSYQSDFWKTGATSNQSASTDQELLIFRWNRQRCLVLFYDLCETLWLTFDTINGLIWPLSTLCICAQDMTLNVETLCECVSRLVHKLQCSTMESVGLIGRENGMEGRRSDEGQVEDEIIALKLRPEQESYLAWRQRSPAFLHQLEEETLVLQSNLVDIFTQLIETDVYVSRLSAFSIFTWLASNMYYQLLSLLTYGLLVPNTLIQCMQILGLFGLTLTFGFLSRTHTKTVKLYRLISNLVALDPNFQSTKSNWPWVLEYFYHKDSSRYSFHLGPTAKLSLANYLKSVSWLITCAFVTLNLLGYR